MKSIKSIHIMRIVSRSHSNTQRKSTKISQSNPQLGFQYCCRQVPYEAANTERLARRNLDGMSVRQSLRDTSYIRSDLQSRLLVKDYKVKIDLKILSIGQVLSEIKKQERKQRGRGDNTKRQKIEVSLSKNCGVNKRERKVFSSIPKLSEIQREHTFLRRFSEKNKIVNAVQKRVEQILQAKNNLNI